MAARPSRIENEDAIDATIVGMLADPKEASRFLSCHFIKLYLISKIIYVLLI